MQVVGTSPNRTQQKTSNQQPNFKAMVITVTEAPKIRKMSREQGFSKLYNNTTELLSDKIKRYVSNYGAIIGSKYNGGKFGQNENKPGFYSIILITNATKEKERAFFNELKSRFIKRQKARGGTVKITRFNTDREAEEFQKQQEKVYDTKYRYAPFDSFDFRG